MIRTIAAALAAFVLASFGVRAEETKPADAAGATKTETKKAEKKSHKKAKKAKKDAAAKTDAATPAK